MRIQFLIIFILAFISCDTKKNDQLNFVRVDYDDGSYEYFFEESKNNSRFEVGFDKDGQLKFFINKANNHIQKMNFFENGVIQSKLKQNLIDEKTSGRAYYFYENSGNLAGDFNFFDGTKTGSAVTYHDSTDRVKEVMLYNDLGELYYRKTFDKYGNFVKVEGSKE